MMRPIRRSALRFNTPPLAIGPLLIGLLLAAPAPAAQCTLGNIAQDGGLETSNPSTGANAFWASTSTNFDSAICGGSNCGTALGAVPRTGTFWFWFGGIDAAETSTGSQSVTIPVGAAVNLNYYLRIGSTQTVPPSNEFTVWVDANVVQTIPEPVDPEAAYTLRTVNLNAFADGAAHTILFEYVHPYAGIDELSTFDVDDISIDVVACDVIFANGFD